MDFQKLEAFFTIANTGKFIDAADKLYVSQSSLSKQMSQLEKELGVKLFKKTRSGIELTQAGYDFYGYARKALSEYRREVAHLQLYKRESTFVLKVGGLPLTEEYGLSECFASYWERNASVQIKFVERNQGDLLDQLTHYRVDIAFVRTDFLDKGRFDCNDIIQDELVLVCPADHPLAGYAHVSVGALRNERFILLEKQSEVTQMFLNACSEGGGGFRPNSPLHHARHRMLIKAVQHHMGISVLSRRLVTACQANDIVCVPFDEPLYSTMGFAWLHGERVSPVARRFMDYVARDLAKRHHLDADEDGILKLPT